MNTYWIAFPSLGYKPSQELVDKVIEVSSSYPEGRNLSLAQLEEFISRFPKETTFEIGRDDK